MQVLLGDQSQATVVTELKGAVASVAVRLRDMIGSFVT